MTINGSTNKSNWTFKLEAYELPNSVNIENNTSVVRVDMYLGCASYTSYLGGNWSGSITVDGQTQWLSGNIYYPTYINGGDWLYLGTRDYTVGHNTAGDKTVGVSASFSSSDFTPSSASASGNLTLTTIPRASGVTATNADIGSATSININRANSSFTHTLKYSFGLLSDTIATNVGTSYGWTIPTSFYAQIPNAKSGICTITCETYNESTHIGTKTTTFTVTANENLCKPTLTGSVKDTNSTTIALTGDSNKLVKYYSNAQVTYSTNSKNSATIKLVTINNVPVTNGSYNFTDSVYDEFVIVTTDSRGYSNSIKLTPAVINYIPLTMNATVTRTAPTTGEVSVSFSGNYFPENFGTTYNELNIGYFYRIKGQEEWEYGGMLQQNSDYVIIDNTYHSGLGSKQKTIILNNTFDYRQIYEIRLYYSDKLIVNYIDQTIVKGKPIVNWDDEMLNVNGKLKINNEEIFNLHIESERECPTNIYVDGEQVFIKRVGIIIWGSNPQSTNLMSSTTNILGYISNIQDENNTTSYTLPNLMLSSATTLSNKSIPIHLKVQNGYWYIYTECNNSEISSNFWGYVTIFYTKSNI